MLAQQAPVQLFALLTTNAICGQPVEFGGANLVSHHQRCKFDGDHKSHTSNFIILNLLTGAITSNLPAASSSRQAVHHHWNPEHQNAHHYSLGASQLDKTLCQPCGQTPFFQKIAASAASGHPSNREGFLPDQGHGCPDRGLCPRPVNSRSCETPFCGTVKKGFEGLEEPRKNLAPFPPWSFLLCNRFDLTKWACCAPPPLGNMSYPVCWHCQRGEMFKRTNLWNKGLISADRSNKATLLLTIPRSLFKSSAKDLPPPIS